MDRKAKFLKISLPFMLAIFVYSNSLTGDFVFDDLEAIVNNPVVVMGGRKGETLFQALKKYDFWGHDALSNNSHKSWRPLTTFSFRINMMLHGLNPIGFRLVNVALHATVVLLFYSFLRTIFQRISVEECKNDRIAYLSTVIFAVHPIHVESVTGIVGRAEVLCALFFVLAVKRFLDSHAGADVSCKIPISCTIFALASLLCKEQGIMCLVVCVALHCLIYCELNFKIIRNYDMKEFMESFWARYSAVLITSLLLCIFRLWFIGFQSPKFSVADNPVAFQANTFYRIINYNYLYALNLWLLINPCSLCYDYSMGCIPVINGPWDVRIIIVLIMWAAFYTIGRSMWSGNLHNVKFAQIGIVLLILPYLPASNLLFRVGFVVAERVLYIPSMGYSVLISTAIVIIRGRLCRLKILCDFTIVLLIAAFSSKCLRRNQDWRDEKTLFLSGARICPNNAKIHYNIGKTSDDVHVAEEAYRLAITLNPSYDHAMNNLANLLKEKGDLVEAEFLLEKALNLRPQFPVAWMNLGIVKAGEKKYVESEYCYLKALSFRTHYADCYFNLGNLYHEMGRSYQAFNCWMNATKFNPKHIKSWINLMLISDEMNETVQALYYGNMAMMHLGENPSIYSIMAGFLGKLNRFQESEGLFLEAIRLETDSAFLYGNLGILYHRWRRYEKALWAYKEALERNPTLESIRRNLDEIISLANSFVMSGTAMQHTIWNDFANYFINDYLNIFCLKFGFSTMPISDFGVHTKVPKWRNFVVKIPTDTNKRLGLRVSSRNGRVYVTTVEPWGMGALVGVQVFDRISRVNKLKVRTKWECEEAIEKFAREADVVVLDMRRKMQQEVESSTSNKTPLPLSTFAKDKSVPIVKKCDYQTYCQADDDKLNVGDPRFGLGKPLAPEDIRHILQTKTQSILDDFEKYENKPSVRSPKSWMRNLWHHRNDPDELLSAKESVTEAKLAKIGADAGAVLFSAKETPSSSSTFLDSAKNSEDNREEAEDQQDEERFLIAKVGDDGAARITPKKR